VYLGWITQVIRGIVIAGQIISRGKKHVLGLRDIVKENKCTMHDKTLYFVDKDFDDDPQPGQFSDVYVTRGYSIENELISWSIVEMYARAYFDIADDNDQAAVSKFAIEYEKLISSYIAVSAELQKTIHICRKNSWRCLPGDNPLDFFSIDWPSMQVRQVHSTLQEMLIALGIEAQDRHHVQMILPSPSTFEKLQPNMDWRGKFHFGMAKKFLIHMKDARVSGAVPFQRAAKVEADPAHPSVMGALASFCAPPECLVKFLENARPGFA
jgi:hypothetical protein